jgi:dephospho-CoA kinase
MLKIGITGGIGSGKSVVSKLIETIGYPVYNSDNEAKKIINTDTDIRRELIELVGDEVYSDSGLNRDYLAAKIFGNDELREKVNSIIHPRVREGFEEFCSQSNSALVFNEAAILVETGAYKNFDKILLVTAPEVLRVERVMLRDSFSEEQVKARVQKQMTDSEKLAYADYHVINDESKPLIKQVESIIDQLISS